MDQLTLIVRYVLPSGPVERFLTFLGMQSHTAEELARRLLDFFAKYGIDIKDCRGQSYDNASNMSGKYKGLQALIKEINIYAEYIPCFAHSLNLVGQCAAVSCNEAIKVFDLINAIYNFFSASTSRWALIDSALKANKLPSVKQLSDTRWSARADAMKALRKGYTVIQKVLDDFSKSQDQKPEHCNKAKGFANDMKNLEKGIMVILWSKLLEQYQKVTIKLQSSKLDLNEACSLYNTLYGFIQAQRDNFLEIEQEAKELTGKKKYKGEIGRQHKRNRKYDEYCGSKTLDPVAES